MVFIPKSCGNYMKKIALALVVLMLFSVFTACNKNVVEHTTTTEATETQPENVVISINKNLVTDETEFIVGISEFEGISVASNENFHILTMSQGTYVTFLKSKAQEVYDMYDSIISEDGFVEDITYNENFRTIKVLVDRVGFDAIGEDSQRLQLITIGAYAMSYQMFLEDGQKTTVIAVYSDTEEEAMVISLPITM